MKVIKGEKYIYLLMAYILAKANKGIIQIGKDTGMIGGQHYQRTFKVSNYEGDTLITESKANSNFTVFSRTFKISGEKYETPTIMEYLNEYGDNCSNKWVH